ncbi:hypothetical protein [Helicobacter pylori]|uniref:hypothetical protein n=1 Tax=Helicobacter pylori TaxID=210 RepID=UPI000EADB191|nr:hypothetical protein [Helicobacter pylori]
MGFQNENKLKLGASVKATINNKVVEAKVISIGFNRVTLRSQKGNEATYAFNSEKFLKWFHKVPLDAVKTAENSKERSTDDLLKNLKVVRSSVKQRVTDPKEPKESKFKLAFGFRESGITSCEALIENYTLAERKARLGILMSPMFFEGAGSQMTAIILTALANAEGLNRHSDAEWRDLIENRNENDADFETFDYMDRVGTTLFCNVIQKYASKIDGDNGEIGDLSPNGVWATILPKNKNEAYFIAQLLCDGGINKYGLSCAGLGKNLLKDIEPSLGLATIKEVDDYLAELDKEAEGEN